MNRAGTGCDEESPWLFGTRDGWGQADYSKFSDLLLSLSSSSGFEL